MGILAFFQFLSCHRDFTCVTQFILSFNKFALSAYLLRPWDATASKRQNSLPSWRGRPSPVPTVPPHRTHKHLLLWSPSYLPVKSQLKCPVPKEILPASPPFPLNFPQYLPAQSQFPSHYTCHQMCLLHHHAPFASTRQCPLHSHCIRCPEHHAWHLVNEGMN